MWDPEGPWAPPQYELIKIVAEDATGTFGVLKTSDMPPKYYGGRITKAPIGMLPADDRRQSYFDDVFKAESYAEAAHVNAKSFVPSAWLEGRSRPRHRSPLPPRAGGPMGKPKDYKPAERRRVRKDVEAALDEALDKGEISTRFENRLNETLGYPSGPSGPHTWLKYRGNPREVADWDQDPAQPDEYYDVTKLKADYKVVGELYMRGTLDAFNARGKKFEGILTLHFTNGEIDGTDWSGPPLSKDQMQEVLDLFANVDQQSS